MTHHALVQGLFHPQQFAAFAFEHFRNRDASPFGDDFGDFLFGHFIAQQGHLLFGDVLPFKAFLQRRNDAVLQLGHPREITRAPGGLEINASLLQLDLDVRCAAQDRFF